MAFVLIIDGVDRSDKVRNVKFSQVDNERATLSFDCEPDFVPARRASVQAYDSDGTTLKFGGVIFNRRYQGLTPGAANAVLSCDCVEAGWYYIDRLTVDAGSFTGTKTLKQVAQWFQTNYLASRGFTLDPAQADGPSIVVDGFSWERTLGTDALRQITEAFGGWRFRASPALVWGFYTPSTTTPSAPFAITDSDARASEVEWSETEEHYYTKVIVRCGGTGTLEHSTFADTGDLIALGYFITDIPSTPTGAVTVSVSGSVTLTDVVAGVPGTTGTYFNWDWAAHKLIVGTLYTPIIGDLVTLIYTAQYPFEVIQDAGVSPALELVVDRPEVTSYATGLSVAAGLLAKHYQDVREFTVYTDEAGLAPGQVLPITRTDRATTLTNTSIISVDSEPVTSTFWQRTAKAISGIYQGSELDYFRSAGGGGSSGVGYTPTYTPGGTAGVTGYALTKTDDTNVTLTLGGSHTTALVNPASITVSWSGQLSVPRGGTGLASVTANRVPYGNGTSALQTSANLTFDGTTLSTHTLAVTTGNATFAANANPVTNYVSNLGNISTKYLTLHAAELWVETLVAAETMATIGGRILVGPTTTLVQDSLAASVFLVVKHNQMDYLDSLYLESNGKLEWIQVASWPITSVDTALERFVIANDYQTFFPVGATFAVRGSTGNNGTWTVSNVSYIGGSNITVITVTGNVTNATADGYIAWVSTAANSYRYLVTRNVDTSGANDWYAGDAVFNTGVTGDGYIDLFSINGVRSGEGPTIMGNVRTSTTYSDIAVRWAIGNLKNIYGYSAADVYGAAFGNASATNITIDATNGFRIRYGTTDKLVADTSGNLSLVGDLTIGTSGSLRSGATAFGTGTGYWLAYNSGTPQFRVGTVSGNRIAWDGTNIEIKSANLTANSGGITLAPKTSGVGYDADTAYKWTVSSGSLGLTGFDYSTLRLLTIISEYTGASGSKEAQVELSASHTNTSHLARIRLNASASLSEVQFLANIVGIDGSLQLSETSAPSATTNTVRLYAEDNGAGKTRLMALFPTGAAQQLAIEA